MPLITVYNIQLHTSYVLELISLVSVKFKFVVLANDYTKLLLLLQILEYQKLC